MTRKEDLHKLADDLVCAVYSQVDGDGEMGTVTYDKCVNHVLVSLQHVEREVWNRVIERIETVMEPQEESTDDQIWEFRDWCKQQQEGL